MTVTAAIPTIHRRLALLLLLALAACAPSRPPAHQGLVEDPRTGLLYGSVLDGALVSEPSFYANPRIKVRVRNTSGDVAFDMGGLKREIEAAYAAKGFVPATDDDFGLLLDLNVAYSGHVQNSLTDQYGFIGALGGGLAGTVQGTVQGQAAGVLAGATLGAVAGSYVREDTYIVVASITFGVIKKVKSSEKKITFSRSEKLKYADDPDEDNKVDLRGFKRQFTRQMAVYAGGLNVGQARIVEEVRRRMARIVSDFI